MTAVRLERMEEAALQPQPFESGLLGGPVFRLALPLASSPEHIDSLLSGARKTRSKLISCRIPASRPDLAAALRDHGFREIETLLTYRRALNPLPAASPHIRASQPSDQAACVAIARAAFRHDRFHADAAIDPAMADDIKAIWVANSFKGRADAILVAPSSVGALGFVICLLKGREAVIDLIAVAESARGQGLGAALLAAALRHYDGRADTMRVGTQRTNLPSNRLYRRFDFAVVDEAVTFHLTPAPA